MGKNEYSTPKPNPKPTKTKSSWFAWRPNFRFLQKPQNASWKELGIFWLKKIAFYFFTSTFVMVILLRFIPILITPTMIVRKFEAIGEGDKTELYYDWKSYDKISKEAALAVVASEDQIYPDHFGLDFGSMWNAFSHNLKGKKIRGASTISQQVAKNVFLWQGRSYIRKILEVYFTMMIEIFWGKERILEVYLNVAEMGDMTFGAEATAQRYFGKHASELNRNEAARIASILPSPRRYSITKPGPYVQKRTNQVMRQMRALGGTAYLEHL
jgi:monofunctional glycosyltransferase